MWRKTAVWGVMGAVLGAHSVVLGVDRFVPSVYGTIQSAIDVAEDGDTVVIAPGAYTGGGNKNLDFGGKAITVTSTNPDDPFVVAATVIDCENSGRGFYFHSGDIVSGLTITGGNSSEGGGMYNEENKYYV